MKSKKKDIRFYRTKERIITAITELLKVKSFDQVTVKDICKKQQLVEVDFTFIIWINMI